MKPGNNEAAGIPLALCIAAALLLQAACAGSDERSKEMEAHFAEREAQQLIELESEEEARKLAARRPPKPVSEFDVRETERNLRYQQAVAAAEKRSGVESLNLPAETVPTIQAPTPSTSWQRANIVHPQSGNPVCAIQSMPAKIDNGGLETLARIIVTADSIFLRTDAILDDGSVHSGLQVDDGPRFAIERYANEVTGVIEDQYRQILIKLALGDTLTVSYRYKPHRIADDYHRFKIDVTEFASLLDGIKNCGT